jgi:hypothetical protein
MHMHRPQNSSFSLSSPSQRRRVISIPNPLYTPGPSRNTALSRPRGRRQSGKQYLGIAIAALSPDSLHFSFHTVPEGLPRALLESNG